MVRDPSSGTVVFRCDACAQTESGRPEDARISGAVLGAGETAEMYQTLVRQAPRDRVSCLVRRDCSCGLDYATQIRVGDAEIVIYKCKCGKETSGSDAPAPAAAATAAKR
jgi:hypothetical protein